MPGKRVKLMAAARRLGCHVETLRIRIRDGRLKATTGPHGAYYVSQEDLAALPRPGQKPPARHPTREKLEASWDAFERDLERYRVANARELELFREVREHPRQNRRLYRVFMVQWLLALDVSFPQIAAELGISARHARRLAYKTPLDALRRDLQTIRSRRRALADARRMVDDLRAELQQQGFRYHRQSLKMRGFLRFRRFRRNDMGQPRPAFEVKELTEDEMRALRRAGLTETQIKAVSLVGMGTDEVNELIVRRIRPSVTTNGNRG
jgi:hypothetical protein